MKSRFASVSVSLLVSAMATCLLPSMTFAADAGKETPEAVYNRYHQKVLTAKTCEEVMPFLVQKTVNQMKETPEKDRTMMFGFIQDSCPKDVHIVSSKVDGDKAMLNLIVGDGKPVIKDNPIIGKTKDETKGEVSMVIEDGQWKIEKEKWNTKSESADVSPPPADAPQGK